MTSSRTDTALVDVTMPQMGVSVAEGTVVGWRVEVGDRIGADQAICDISTDKIDTEVPAPVAGVVAEILVPIDETVDVGTVLARIAVGSGSAAGAAPISTPSGSAAEAAPISTPLRRLPPPPPRPPSLMHRNPGRQTGRATVPPAPRRPRATCGVTPPSSSASPPSTASTSHRWRGPDVAGACASRTCSHW